MTKSELIERIEVWRGFCNQHPLPPPQSAVGALAAGAVERGWAAGLFRNVGEMSAAPEMIGHESEGWLKEAKRLAAGGNPGDMATIRDLLNRVHLFLVGAEH